MLLDERPPALPMPDEPTGLQRSLRGLAPRRSRRARLLLNLVTVAVTVGFSYIALSNIQLSKVWDTLRTIDLWWMLPALVVFLLGNLARALRWRSLFAPERRPALAPVANAMLVGYFYNNILPARAGEPIRVVVLAQRSEAAPVEIVGTVVLERLYDVLAILVVFFVAEPWLPHVSWFGAAAVAAIVLAVGIAAVATILVVFGDRPVRLVLRPLGRLRWISSDRLERTVAELVHGLSGLRRPSVAIPAFLWTTVAWLLSAFAAWLVTLAFPFNLPFASGILLVVAVGLGMILPSPPAAVGVFEGAALIALKAYGLPHDAALPYALILHVLNFVPFVGIGAFLLWHNARHPGSRAATAGGPSEPAFPAAPPATPAAR
jgi:uncharacterized protein (TIRG00374 family)